MHTTASLQISDLKCNYVVFNLKANQAEPLCFYFFLILRYMGDFYELELQSVSGVRGWSIPETKGGGPSARESHTAVSNTGLGSPKLYIFGGMQGCRLNDLWQLDLGRTVENGYQKLSEGKSIKMFFLSLDTMVWSTPQMRGLPPIPRSLHSATVIGNK